MAPLDPTVERQLAVDLFNATWQLLDTPDRSPDDDLRMLHMAHASRHHWAQVGEPVNLARGEWQVSRVYAVLGRAEPARFHGERCLEICEEYGIADFDLAYAYEALARAAAVSATGPSATADSPRPARRPRWSPTPRTASTSTATSPRSDHRPYRRTRLPWSHGPSDHDRRAPRRRLSRPHDQGRAPREPAREAPRRRRALPRAGGVRRLGAPRDRTRDPRGPRPDPVGGARAGQDAPRARDRPPARRGGAGDRGLRDQRPPVPPDLRPVPRSRRGRSRRGRDPLAATRGPLRGEARHARYERGRPDRRRRPDQGGRGSVARRRAHDPLRDDPSDPPRHRGDQRAPGPARADPGLALQHHGGTRRPDPRLPDPAAARPAPRRDREPRRLHAPRQDRRAAEGPLRDRRCARTIRRPSPRRSGSWGTRPRSPTRGSRCAFPSS